MKMSIRNCRFAFKCFMKWDDLKLTDEADVRYCGKCEKNVYFCHTDTELWEAIRLNRCIAIDADQSDGSAPKRQERTVFMGSPARS